MVNKRPGVKRTGWAVAGRFFAAALGGYAVSAAAAVCLAGLAATARAEAVTGGILLGFAVFPAAAVWAFAARTPQAAWGGLLGAAGLLAGLAWVGGAWLGGASP